MSSCEYYEWEYLLILIYTSLWIVNLHVTKKKMIGAAILFVGKFGKKEFKDKGMLVMASGLEISQTLNSFRLNFQPNFSNCPTSAFTKIF